jgi:hypothetical protein
MKKQFTAVCRTKAEQNSNGAAATVAPQNFATLSSAKSFLRTNLTGATPVVSFGEIFGVSGLVWRLRNPGGA